MELGMGLVGRKLLSSQSPQERDRNGGGNHRPGCERGGGRGIEKNKRADKTKRRKERKGREITEERDKEEEMFITQRLELRPFQTNR